MQAVQVFETMEPVFDKRPEFLPVMVRSLHGNEWHDATACCIQETLCSFTDAAQPAARCSAMPSLLQTCSQCAESCSGTPSGSPRGA